MSACDQLEADIAASVTNLDLEVLCAYIENVSMISDHAVKANAPRITFVGDAEMWRFVAACAIVKLNEELARRHDLEVARGDE